MKGLKTVFQFLIAIVIIETVSVLLNQISPNDELKKEKSCSRFPRDEHIFTDNVIWQVLETPLGFIYILNAYLDARWNRTIVRINVIAPANITKSKMFCQFWFDEDSQPIVVETSEFQTLWFNSKQF